MSKNGTLIILTSVLFLLSIWSAPSFGADKIFYYQTMLKSWGLDSQVVTPESPTNSGGIFHVALSKDIDADMKKYIQDAKSNFIIICTDEFTLFQDLKCGYDYMNSVENGNPRIISLGSKKNADFPLSIGRYDYDNHTILLIPEVYLLSPDYSSIIQRYIAFISGSTDINRNSNISPITDYLESNKSLIVLFIYSVFAIVFAVFVLAARQIKYCVGKVGNSNIKHFIVNVLFPMVLKWKLLILVISLTQFVLFLVYLYSKHRASLFSDEFIFQSVTDFIQLKQKYLKYYLYLFGLAILIVLNIIVLFGKKIRTLYNHVLYQQMPLRTLRALYITPVYVFVLILSFTNQNQYEKYISIIIFLLFYASFVLFKHSADLSQLFSPKEKLSFCTVLGLTILFGNILSPTTNKTTEYPRTNLVNDINEPVTLPYSLPSPTNKLFNAYNISPDFNIFVNNLMVFSRDFHQINNFPINEFVDGDNTIVISGSKNEYLRHIAKYPEITDRVDQNSPSKYFLLPVMDLPPTDEHSKISFQFDCSSGLDASSVQLFYYPTKTSDPVKNRQLMNILAFPGCSPNSTDNTYTVPVDLTYQNEIPGLYEIYKFESQKIVDIKVEYLGKPIPLQHIPDPGEYPLLYTSPGINLNSDELNVYTFGLKKSHIFIRKYDYIDISEIINSLLMDGTLTENINIWSDVKYNYIEMIKK